ncbi:hypothetical protein AB0K20_31160 [Micromonospora matsumotoense]|uniref:hypothetical protein n=1 Tax=Micromonospora matsumotoense TaxID=121616 RepID=UPI003427CAD9
MKAPAEEQGAQRAPARPAAPPPTRPAGKSDAPAAAHRAPTARPLSPAVAQRLQAAAGNRAVSALVAQRRAAGSTARRPPPAARPASGGRAGKTGSASSPSPATVQPTTAPTSGGTGPEVVDPAVRVPVQRLAAGATVRRPGPNADPKFAALKANVRGKQQVLGAHPPASAEAARAQGAAKPPQDDREAQGKAANAEKMNAAKPGEFDKAAFVRAVNEAIAAQSPKNLDEADKFGDSGKADAVKGQVQGQVGEGKKASANAIETTTKAPPDTSKAVDKKVMPLVADRPPPTPGAPDPAKAVPDKAPPAATDLSGAPKQVDQQMAEAQVTEEQLARSNEPEFTGALKEKNAAEQHATTAPGQVRASEAQTLAGAKAAAGTAGATAMAALAGDRKVAGAQVGAGKEQAKSEDEAKRAKVTGILQKVFDATKKDVEGILSGLDKKVDDTFSAGEKAARNAFTAEHKRRMDEYKDKRYSGIVGKGRWIKDKFAGLPEEANQIFVVARKGYVDRMQQVISGVADVIGAELGRAKQRIAAGRDELQAEVKKLPADLQAIGKEAAGEFAGKFDELTEQVNSKGTELVQTLASKYNEALKAVDEEIAAEKEKNKGLVAKAVDAVAGVIKTIMQLKDMLMGVLAKAAQAVAAIIKDPIGFLGNLVTAVGAGLKLFLGNIGEHLKKGLIGWLTGAMAGAGLELPAKFDLRGIVLMIGSMLGLTWASIRALIIKRGVPEPAMGAVEKSVPVVQKVQAQGLGGMWEEIQDKVGDLKANLFAKISEYLIPTILIAGITWIISLLNPASAFVRAVKMIIDFVTFIVTQGAQIIEFVNSVLDAIIAIAGGGTGGVPALIEKALARSVPVLIGVLAAVLGVGGIAQKVQKFFKALSKPVTKAVDWVVEKIVALGKKVWAKFKTKAKRKHAKNLDATKGADPDRMPLAQKEQVTQAAAQDTYRQIIARKSLRAIPDLLRAAMARWAPKGVKEIWLEQAGGNSFRVQVKLNPTYASPAFDWVPGAANNQHFLTYQQARKGGNTTWANGSFVVSQKSGKLFGPSRSDPYASARMEAGYDRKKKGEKNPHAEETVAAWFREHWNGLVEDQKKAGSESPGSMDIRFDLDVGCSCCVNCAAYVAKFVNDLRAAGGNVHARVKFASLYRGGQEEGAWKNPTTIPASTIELHRDLFEEFLGNGFLAEGGLVQESQTPGRYWGNPGEVGDRKPTDENWYTIKRDPRQGELALAILRTAGIAVTVMNRRHLAQEELAEEEVELRNKDMQTARRDLAKAITKVNSWLKSQKVKQGT